MPFFKNKPTINHEEFHYFDFNGSKCRLDRKRPSFHATAVEKTVVIYIEPNKELSEK